LRHAALMEHQRHSSALMRPAEPRMPACIAPPSPLAAHGPLTRPTSLKVFRGFSAQRPPAGQAKQRAIEAPSLCRRRGGSARNVQPPYLRSRGLVVDLGAHQVLDGLGVMSCQTKGQERARSSKGRGGGPQGQGSGWECAKRATGSRRHRRRRPQEGGGRKSPSSAEEG
jgi:hypothetical protein